MRKALLFCGILCSGVYIAANVIVPMKYAGYDWVSQTVSELSAIGSPVRDLWIALMMPFTFLLIAFGVGVWLSAGTSRKLRWVGVLIILHSVCGWFWPPMHMRGAEFTLTDTLHIVWTAVLVPVMMAQILIGGLTFGRSFRSYSLVTVLIMLVFGLLTGIEGPNIAKDLPTPCIGVLERIGMLPYAIWLPVFAIRLWR